MICAHVEIADNSAGRPSLRSEVPRRGGATMAGSPATLICCPGCRPSPLFTLPARTVAPIASTTRPVSTTRCSKAAAETLIAIAANPKHLGARVGFTAVLHQPGVCSDFHRLRHVHMIVPGGGSACSDRPRWIACKPRFFLTVRALFPARQGAVAPCSGGCFSKGTHGVASGRAVGLSSAICNFLLTSAPSSPAVCPLRWTDRAVHWCRHSSDP